MAHVLRPDGTSEPVKLAADADRPGMFVGQLSVLQEGTYQVALPLPGGDDAPLSRFLQVRVPDLERLCTRAVQGTAGRFDVFASLPQPRFPGGARLRWPLLMLAMSWYALRDRF